MAQSLEDRAVGLDDSSSDHPIHLEECPKRVRVLFGGATVADSKRVLLMREARHLPVYYFPIDDVRMDLLVSTERTTRCPYKGEASYWTVKVGEREAENAVWAYREPLPERAAIRGYLAFYWDRMDAWYEEDDEVFVHPRDPHHRVDVLNSSRHVKVVVDGQVVAETTRPRLLFETGLPTRYYIPKLDVRMDLLEPTDRVTACPYKGRASYWSLKLGDRVVENLVWSYPNPIPECPKIENLLSFFNEKVDVYVDGELQPRPKTNWS